MPQCKFCPAQIGWLITQAGAKMCYDPGVIYIRTHVPGTPTTTIVTRDGRVLRGTRITPTEARDLYETKKTQTARGFVPHKITCSHFKEENT